MKMKLSLLPALLLGAIVCAASANAQSDDAAQSAERNADAELAKANAERAKADAELAKADAERAEEMGHGVPYSWSYSYGSSDRNDHSLVIRSSETDAKTVAADEEDLNIMGRILEKAIATAGESEDHQAMGIRVFTSSSSSSPKNLEIEGYGAVFFLNVGFPLTGPQKKTDDGAAKEPANSTWDEARRELYGPAPGRGERVGSGFGHAGYDPKRVDGLKDSLLEALKNASNIRNLKSDENVTLVVKSGGEGMGGFESYSPYSYQQRITGISTRTPISAVVSVAPAPPEPPAAPATPADPARPVQASGSGGGGSSGGAGGGGSSGGSGGGGGSGARGGAAPKRHSFATTLNKINGGEGAVLTIRARKADIDAFAKGKLSFDEFKNKAAIQIY